MDGSSRDVDLTLNYYDVLGVAPDASAHDIRKAYQRKALALHPDKQKDLPPAQLAAVASEFHRVQTAYELLSDSAARAALDVVLGARVRAAQKRSALSGKRKQLQEDLERREAVAAQSKDVERAEATLRQHMDRIRADNVRRMEREAADAAPRERHMEQVLKRARTAGEADTHTTAGQQQPQPPKAKAVVKPFSQQYTSLEAYERVVLDKLTSTIKH